MIEGSSSKVLPLFFMNFRIGIGRDFHRLSDERMLFLGGVLIPHAPGCIAHSDGDCLLHALMDALLGAASQPNIGVLFPDNDPKNKGRSSLEMLSVVMNQISKVGFRVVNVDASVLLERPKISKFFHEMKAKIAPILGLSENEVGLKATTNEEVGLIGAGEAMEVICVCLLEKI